MTINAWPANATNQVAGSTKRKTRYKTRYNAEDVVRMKREATPCEARNVETISSKMAKKIVSTFSFLFLLQRTRFGASEANKRRVFKCRGNPVIGARAVIGLVGSSDVQSSATWSDAANGDRFFGSEPTPSSIGNNCWLLIWLLIWLFTSVDFVLISYRNA